MSYDKLERLERTLAKPPMHPNTKFAIDGIWASGMKLRMREMALCVSISPQELAGMMAESMELFDDDPLTPQERKMVAAELRSGVADDYIAGLLGYV